MPKLMKNTNVMSKHQYGPVGRLVMIYLLLQKYLIRLLMMELKQTFGHQELFFTIYYSRDFHFSQKVDKT